MTDSGHILVINPGSTSTKLGVFQFQISARTLYLSKGIALKHSARELESGPVINQLDFRLKAVREFLQTIGIKPDLIMARGAPLYPMEGGIYPVNEVMLHDLRSARYANHASNLAALIGFELACENKCPVHVADPITTDEFHPLARISGVPGIERKSRSHALNIKAITRKVCLKKSLGFLSSQWVVCHMGSGISVAALRKGRIIDVNDALLGMGPFGPERAGALPLSGLIKLAFTRKLNQDALETLLSSNSGLKGYLGTNDLKEVDARMRNGDDHARLVFRAMAYQIAKEISAMASVLKFDLDGIILTGGMAHSKLLCDTIIQRISPIAPVTIEAGENELEALAQAGFRVLCGEERVQNYCSR